VPLIHGVMDGRPFSPCLEPPLIIWCDS